MFKVNVTLTVDLKDKEDIGVLLEEIFFDSLRHNAPTSELLDYELSGGDLESSITEVQEESQFTIVDGRPALKLGTTETWENNNRGKKETITKTTEVIGGETVTEYRREGK